MDTDQAQSSWKLNEPWPATLIAPRAGSDTPDLEAILVELATHFGEEVVVLELHGSPDDRHPWSVLIRIPGLDAPVLFACQQAQKMSEVPPRLTGAIADCRWVILIETLLDAESPLKDWLRLAEVVGRDPAVPALLDAITGRWFDREELEETIFDDSVPASEDLLWQVRVVSGSPNLEEGKAWLFTTGLLRCGLPELEMLEVPAQAVSDAARMLDVVASLILDEGPPPPEQPWQIGERIEIAMVPWREVVDTLDQDSLGSTVDREQLSQETPNPLTSIRAVICDSRQRGTYRKIWSWPIEAMKSFASPNAAVRRSSHGVARSAALARKSWDQVVDAFKGGSEDLVVMVGVPVGIYPHGGREHGWIQLSEASTDGGVGRVLRDADTGLPEGGLVPFKASELDGWRLVRGGKVCGEMDLLDPVAFARGES